MAKLFLKELKLQLELTLETINEIKDRGTTDAFGTRVRKADLEEYRALCARRRALRKQIIHFEP